MQDINHSHLKKKTYTRFIPACTLIVAMIYCYTRRPVKMPRKPKRPQLMGHRNNTVASLACGYVGMATRAPQHSPSQQALRLQPIGFQLSVHFKGMLASLRASVHSFKSPAVGSARQTSHIFHTVLQRDGREERERIPFHKRSCPKTSRRTVLYSVLHPNSEGQGAVGQSHFL